MIGSYANPWRVTEDRSTLAIAFARVLHGAAVASTLSITESRVALAHVARFCRQAESNTHGPQSLEVDRSTEDFQLDFPPLEEGSASAKSLSRFFRGQISKSRAMGRQWRRATGRQNRADFVDLLKWSARVRYGSRHRLHGRERCAVVILSYKRPENIEMLVRSALQCDCVGRVWVHNNNQDFRLRDWVRVCDPRVSLVEAPKPVLHGVRWALSLADQVHHFFLSIDDDVFLSPEQISFLFESLVHDPSVPHGCDGEVHDVGISFGVPMRNGGLYPFRTGVGGTFSEQGLRGWWTI